ncbi:MAG: hypothetical protein AAGI54_11490 [Planctomycetota bacterium]
MAIGDSFFCGDCGYELTGLHHSGSCPECGRAYDMGSGVGVSSEASRRSARGDFLMRRLRTIALGLITLGIVGLTVLVASLNQSIKPVMWGGLFAAIAGLATLTSFLYERSED